MNKYQEALDYINKSICTLLALQGIQDEKVIKNLHILQELVDKLSQLEDIEEELGIDLVTLFKALKSKEVIYKRKRGIVHRETTLETYVILGLAFDDEYYGLWVYDKFGDEMLLYVKDYGKTWALTKEELENE